MSLRVESSHDPFENNSQRNIESSSANESGTIWSNAEFSMEESANEITMMRNSKEKEETVDEAAERIMQRALNSQEDIEEFDVPEGVADRLGDLEWYNVYTSKRYEDHVYLKLTLKKEYSKEAIQNMRMQLAFENNMDVKGIITDSRYGFFAGVPQNYRHDVTELEDGTFKHSFISIKENTIRPKDANSQIQIDLFENNKKEVKLENLSRENAEKIKPPKGYTVTLTDNEYGYTNVLITRGSDELESFAEKLKYCFAKKINAMQIGPSTVAGPVNSGIALYGVKIPEWYYDRCERTKDGKFIHNLVYDPEKAGKSSKSGDSSGAESADRPRQKRKSSSYSSGESGWSKVGNWFKNLFKSSDEAHFTKQTGQKQKLHRTCKAARRKKIARGEV